MAQDIVPIEVGLTQGDLVTLWAPRWREEGEEWEAFLGHGDELYAFPGIAHLAAFTRTATEHDLADHPAWHVVPALSVSEFAPDDSHQFDLVGVPELVAEEPDTWTIAELADIVSIVRSLADVCELDVVHEVLDSAEAFSQLQHGAFSFTGRDGEQRWTQLASVVAERWDEVLDAIDAVVAVPDIDQGALAEAEAELAAEEEAAASSEDEDEAGEDTEEAETEEDDEEEDEEPAGFWFEIGIDPVKIVTNEGEFYTLRCYLDDQPVFLGSNGKIDVFGSPRALAQYLAQVEEDGADNDIAGVSTWPEVVAAATTGEIAVEVDQDNTYILAGLDEDIADGPDAVDPTQVELAVELLSDAADWSGDDSVQQALAPSESLGWLVSFVVRPDPSRLAPSAPYDAEVAAWRTLVTAFEERLHTH
jgi:hypothetical protein